jgi:hypothetical protein
MRFGGLIFLRLMKLNYSTSVLESSRQDTLSKVLINLASGSLLRVLVLYLVLHQGTGMRTQQVVVFKEMGEQRSRHQILGKLW